MNIGLFPESQIRTITMDELTGWEEHQDFEASAEAYEVSVMRYEAEEAMLAEARIHELELAERQAEWEAQQADPLRAVCLWGQVSCKLGGHDDCPF